MLINSSTFVFIFSSNATKFDIRPNLTSRDVFCPIIVYASLHSTRTPSARQLVIRLFCLFTQCIKGSYVDLKSVVEVDSLALNNTSAMALQSDAIFEFIISKVNEDPAKAKAVNGIFLYIITKDGKQAKQWTMDLKAGKVYEGAPTGVKPNTTLTISDEDFVQLATGKLNPQSAFMKGKLKVTGNVMMAQKLGPLLKAADAKL